jgi:hypothetical protein
VFPCSVSDAILLLSREADCNLFLPAADNCFFIPITIDDDVLKMYRIFLVIPVALEAVQLSPAHFAKGLFLAAPFPF